MSLTLSVEDTVEFLTVLVAIVKYALFGASTGIVGVDTQRQHGANFSSLIL